MNEPSDGIRLLFTVLFAAWVMILGLSVFDFGGFNQTFLGWQGIIICLAIAIFGISRKWPQSSPVRKMGILPLLVLLLALLAFAFLPF